jgi:hypothetical protein
MGMQTFLFEPTQQPWLTLIRRQAMAIKILVILQSIY